MTELPNMDALIRELLSLRDTKRELEKRLKAVEEQFTIIGNEVISLMDLQGLSAIKNEFASVSISETTRPGVNDWDAFFKYIREHDAGHLLERRPASKACQELTQLGEEIPGIYFFTTRKPNLRTL